MVEVVVRNGKTIAIYHLSVSPSLSEIERELKRLKIEGEILCYQRIAKKKNYKDIRTFCNRKK